MGEDSRLRAVVELVGAIAGADGAAGAARVAAGRLRAALGAAHAEVRLDGLPPAAAGDPAAAGEPLVLPLGERGELRVTGADPGYARLLAAAAGAALTQHVRLAEARRLAYTDPLTGLANRRAVDLRLAEALRRHRATGTVLSLVVCDVNGLKRVNDTHGHEAGDRLLRRFAGLLADTAASLGGDALAARLGGDEFCVLADGPRLADVERAADRVCARALELRLGQGAACGIASTGEPIGPLPSARRLFRLADAAQYRAKAAGSRRPVVAGRAGRDDPVVALADTPAPDAGDRRRFRGRRPGPPSRGGR